MKGYTEYRIGELAEAAGVSRRTIHYYVGRGLLPAPDGAGLGTTYSDEHLHRLLLIKKLQEEYLPLEQIKLRLAGMGLGEVRGALDDDAHYCVTDAPIELEPAPGGPYRRVDLGLGLELHFPDQPSQRARALIDELLRLAGKMTREA